MEQSITVNASELIEVRGTGFNGTTRQIQPSAIQSAGILIPLVAQQQFRLSNTVTGPAGNVTLNTPRLEITDRATATVRHNHLGNAGTLIINASEVLLDTGGSLTASTQSGQGGNINLRVQDTLQLRNGSAIDAESFGTGDGGNVTIDAPTIVGLENSDIIANAVQGSGGNIQINTQGIFGLENRPQLTPESDITASSQFGVSGTVAINNPTADSSLGVTELAQDPIDPGQQVTAGCQQLGESQFVASGRGGIPASPDSTIQGTRIWNDLRDLPVLEDGEPVDSAILPATPKPLTEATTWVRNDRGQIELVAVTARMGDRFSPPQCHPLANSPQV